MSALFDEHFEDLSDLPAGSARLRNMALPKQSKKQARANAHAARKQKNAQILSEYAPQQDETLRMSYRASRHEALWLESSLRDLYVHQWFSDVLHMVKGGKEASVYVCKGGAATSLPLVAAKVYRPRIFRSLKNDAVYREGRSNLDSGGREIIDERALHAIRKRTEFGRSLMHTSWLEHEFKTMEMLYDAGLDVPRPLASAPNAIVMEYFGEETMSAPTLSDIELDATEARILFERVLHNIDGMLAHKRVHADLSAFNILYWEGEIVLIDFPQAINPDQNGQAYPIFERDVTRVCEYFQRQGVPSRPRQIAAMMWEHHRFHMGPPVNYKELDEGESLRDIWESLKNR